MSKTPNHLGGHCNITHVDEGVLKFFQTKGCKTFLDIGCGPGGQVASAKKLGYSAFGVDGDPNVIYDGILQHDFTTQGTFLHPNRPFDLVWSVEVAEHIVEEFERFFIQTLVYNSAKFLVLTASMDPGGTHHVNLKPLSYWIRAVEKVSGWKLQYNAQLTNKVLAASTMKREFIRNNGMVFVGK